MDIDGVRIKLKRTRHFHFIFVSKILSYNFILITSRLPISSFNLSKEIETNLKITGSDLSKYIFKD